MVAVEGGGWFFSLFLLEVLIVLSTIVNLQFELPCSRCGCC
jgi:hypothetical protein